MWGTEDMVIGAKALPHVSLPAHFAFSDLGEPLTPSKA